MAFCFTCFFCQGQTISIPGATQQPKWTFAFFLTDSTGARDTLYYGFDPSATPYPANCSGGDAVFGENCEPMDVVNFQAFAFDNSVDSIGKVDIRDTANFQFSMAPYYLKFANGVYPFTLKWDVILLRSDSIPFPNQNPFPRAQIELWLNGTIVNDPDCNTTNPITLSDTVVLQCTCSQRDSIVVSDPLGFTGPQSGNFYFYIKPWSGCALLSTSDEIENSSIISVYPNPSKDIIFIDSKERILELAIFDIAGRQVNEIFPNGNSMSNAIDVQDLPDGIYFLKAKSFSGNSFFKIIKSK